MILNTIFNILVALVLSTGVVLGETASTLKTIEPGIYQAIELKEIWKDAKRKNERTLFSYTLSKNGKVYRPANSKIGLAIGGSLRILKGSSGLYINNGTLLNNWGQKISDTSLIAQSRSAEGWKSKSDLTVKSIYSVTRLPEIANLRCDSPDICIIEPKSFVGAPKGLGLKPEDYYSIPFDPKNSGTGSGIDYRGELKVIDGNLVYEEFYREPVEQVTFEHQVRKAITIYVSHYRRLVLTKIQ